MPPQPMRSGARETTHHELRRQDPPHIGRDNAFRPLWPARTALGEPRSLAGDPGQNVHRGRYFHGTRWMASKGSGSRRFTGHFGPMLMEDPRQAEISRGERDAPTGPLRPASPGRARNMADGAPRRFLRPICSRESLRHRSGLKPGQPVTAADAIACGPGPVTGTVVGRAGSEVCVRLAVSGWRIRWRLQPDGRTVIEVCDETGVLPGLVVGTRLPIVSAD